METGKRIGNRTHRRQHQLNRDSVTFGGATIQPSSTVRDIGVVLDSELSLSPHINLAQSTHQPARQPLFLSAPSDKELRESSSH